MFMSVLHYRRNYRILSQIIGNNGRVRLISSNYTKGWAQKLLKVSILYQIHVHECPSVSISTNRNQSGSFKIRSQDRNGSVLIILKTMTSRDPSFRSVRVFRFCDPEIDGSFLSRKNYSMAHAAWVTLFAYSSYF